MASITLGKYTAEYLEDKLRKQLLTSFVRVVDESNGGCPKFSAIVVSEKFEGKSLVEQQRLVNAALYEELPDIHAFSQKTYTPDKWQKHIEKTLKNEEQERNCLHYDI